ncbi:MAG: putative cytochrome c [Candidatus Scalindua rubra]|uniref:Putative cytochrome c n=1 Tax=Candidatus Scalindua rubra TaxID=1872076 RepID=A0A1E3XEN0_9BACT|nr:MAG: putative cytochrome c [Candidatus Scalindua rubra]
MTEERNIKSEINKDLKGWGSGLIILGIIHFAVIFQPIEVLARAPMRFNYVGVEMCKLCHKGKELGNQCDVWTNTPHSKAFYTLGTPEAKEVSLTADIKYPQQSNKCLRCHSTAYAFTEEKVAEDLQVEDGVQCESCHGPGEEYMYVEVMENKEDAKAMGLVIPTEETCRKCHNPECPTWDPERDPTPEGKRVGFYFPLRWKMIENHKQ